VHALNVPHAASPTCGHVSVSIGIASFDEDSPCWVVPSGSAPFIADPRCTAAELVQSADHALYAAKSAGRARACRLDISDVDVPARACQVAPRAQSNLSNRPNRSPAAASVA
jgi:predicted signal transduction protein with EAL and GGDEF domain